MWGKSAGWGGKRRGNWLRKTGRGKATWQDEPMSLTNAAAKDDMLSLTCPSERTHKKREIVEEHWTLHDQEAGQARHLWAPPLAAIYKQANNINSRPPRRLPSHCPMQSLFPTIRPSSCPPGQS